LLLVFVAFVYARGEAMATKRGDKFKHVARAGLAPFVMLLACTWLCLSYLQGDLAAYAIAVVLFRTVLVVTGLYAFIVLFIYL
jgi:hypothetical protein